MSKALVSSIHESIVNTLKTFTRVDENHPLKGLATYTLNYMDALERTIISDFTPSKVAESRINTLKSVEDLLKVKVQPYENILDAQAIIEEEVKEEQNETNTESKKPRIVEWAESDSNEPFDPAPTEVPGCDPVATVGE